MNKTIRLNEFWRWIPVAVCGGICIKMLPLTEGWHYFGFMFMSLLMLIWYLGEGAYGITIDELGITQKSGVYRDKKMLWSDIQIAHVKLGNKEAVTEVILRNSPRYDKFVRIRLKEMSKKDVTLILNTLIERRILPPTCDGLT